MAIFLKLSFYRFLHPLDDADEISVWRGVKFKKDVLPLCKGQKDHIVSYIDTLIDILILICIMDIDIQKKRQFHFKIQNLLKLTQIEKDCKVNSFNFCYISVVNWSE